MIQPVKDYTKIVQNALFDALKAILRLNDEDAEFRIRYSYPVASGGQSFDITPEDDVVFIRLMGAGLGNSGVTEAYHEGTGEDLDRTVMAYTSFAAQFVCYGPRAEETAHMIKVGMFEPEVMELLRPADIRPVEDEAMPVAMSEPYNGVWYERRDISISYYQTREYVGVVPAIVVAPEIMIVEEN